MIKVKMCSKLKFGYFTQLKANQLNFEKYFKSTS